MDAFGPTNLSGVRWLAVYPTPEPMTVILLASGVAVAEAKVQERVK